MRLLKKTPAFFLGISQITHMLRRQPPLLFFVLLTLGMNPSFAQEANKAASSSIKSGTQATSNALNSVILGNALGAGGFKMRLGSTPSLIPLAVADSHDANDRKVVNTGESSYTGGSAASPDLSNWSIWATPVFSSFKNNIAPYTSKGDVSIALVGVEYNHNDTVIAGLSYAYSSIDATPPTTVESSRVLVLPFRLIWFIY